MAALLEAENARLHQRIEALVAENARLKGEDAQAHLQLELTQLKEQLALMQQRLFGASSEKLGDRPPKPPRIKPQRGHGPRVQPELNSLIETARLRGEAPGHYLRRAALAAIETPGTVTLPQSPN
ncbi:hypothetical protein ACLESD_14940 [Pyxidicoccus sp. 3LFB2]